ncbi:hypothetical protein ACFPES_01640 [Paenibacillus sp. GCM10023248]|uniref:hypothetical protein n=1 Tax=Bacillales TaxID=1385 RepID=UPI002377D91E|nr:MULTISPECIES: hypothetical protein [Bacillales]MDD9265725.1 hypothetical protein [Paenibacillus sp. MAHUQ-63]MDR6878967.1 hypothetical protein [Bacillus sp. 3255]
MKLNWRKIAVIVLCAELLLIYWHVMSAVPFKQQRHDYPIASPKPPLPLNDFEQAAPSQLSEPISYQVHS